MANHGRPLRLEETPMQPNVWPKSGQAIGPWAPPAAVEPLERGREGMGRGKARKAMTSLRKTKRKPTGNAREELSATPLIARRSARNAGMWRWANFPPPLPWVGRGRREDGEVLLVLLLLLLLLLLLVLLVLLVLVLLLLVLVLVLLLFFSFPYLW
ncbi:unnamed protein product [Prorocentrum cordatum]|uniref:Uncharacterized protein n=1 Tax=Prorocentrum cordatum TaxID=2364126 RepID=A0ABN9TPA8_9DINO|nr:unnamed protein product [Polarella glacialis]